MKASEQQLTLLFELLCNFDIILDVTKDDLIQELLPNLRRLHSEVKELFSDDQNLSQLNERTLERVLLFNDDMARANSIYDDLCHHKQPPSLVEIIAERGNRDVSPSPSPTPTSPATLTTSRQIKPIATAEVPVVITLPAIYTANRQQSIQSHQTTTFQSTTTASDDEIPSLAPPSSSTKVSSTVVTSPRSSNQSSLQSFVSFIDQNPNSIEKKSEKPEENLLDGFVGLSSRRIRSDSNSTQMKSTEVDLLGLPLTLNDSITTSTQQPLSLTTNNLMQSNQQPTVNDRYSVFSIVSESNPQSKVDDKPKSIVDDLLSLQLTSQSSNSNQQNSSTQQTSLFSPSQQQQQIPIQPQQTQPQQQPLFQFQPQQQVQQPLFQPLMQPIQQPMFVQQQMPLFGGPQMISTDIFGNPIFIGPQPTQLLPPQQQPLPIQQQQQQQQIPQIWPQQPQFQPIQQQQPNSFNPWQQPQQQIWPQQQLPPQQPQQPIQMYPTTQQQPQQQK